MTLDATSHAVLAAPLSIWLARTAASVTRHCLAMIQGPDAGDPNCVFPDEYGDTNDGYSACLVRSQLHARTAQDDESLDHRTGFFTLPACMPWQMVERIMGGTAAVQDTVRRSLVTATAASSCIACALMGLGANMPVALAPGMGLNAYFSAVVGYRGSGTVSLL